MKKLTIFIVLAFVMVLCATPVYANGIPALPHAFYGSVTINGVLASPSTQVEARGAGVTAGIEDNPTITTVTGIYGTANPFEHRLIVQGDIEEGTTITFYVNGYSTNQTATWHSGEVTELPLSVTIPVAAGGPPAVGPPAGYMMVSEFIRADGVFTDDVTAPSDDGVGKLIIERGTTGLTKDGQPLSYISFTTVAEANQPPIGAGIQFAGNVYDLCPDGATFSPPITLSFTLDASLVPVDTTQAISYWDPALGAWVNLATTVTFDPATNSYTFTAEVSHFTKFAVLAYEVEVPPPTPAPAAFTASSLVISPTEVAPGKEVSISISVANTGGTEGTYAVILKINGIKEAEKSVTVAAGKSKPVSFTISRDVAGTYSVDVNRLTGSFTVKEVPVPVPPTPVVPPELKAPINWPLIGGIIAGVVVVGLLIFFLVRRRSY